jgi:hypothetical protein
MGSSQSRWNVVVVVVNISITIALLLSSSSCTKSAHRKQTDISILQPSAAFGCTKLLHSRYCLSTIFASQKESNFQQLSNSDFLMIIKEWWTHFTVPSSGKPSATSFTTTTMCSFGAMMCSKYLS